MTRLTVSFRLPEIDRIVSTVSWSRTIKFVALSIHLASSVGWSSLEWEWPSSEIGLKGAQSEATAC